VSADLFPELQTDANEKKAEEENKTKKRHPQKKERGGEGLNKHGGDMDMFFPVASCGCSSPTSSER